LELALTDGMSVDVPLSESDVAEATAMGNATHAEWQSRPGHYPNRLKSHVLGKLGEVGVEIWLRSQGYEVDPAFRDLTRQAEADLIVTAHRLEVKSWDVSTWDDMGRCIRPTQVQALTRKADSIIWTVVDRTSEDVRVVIQGWSSMADVQAAPVRVTGPPHLRLENHQLDVDELRDVASLRLSA
jgi:hypothetical protein